MSTCRATRDAILGMDLLLHERSGWRDLLRTQVEESVQVVRPSQQVGAGYPFPAAHPGDVFTGTVKMVVTTIVGSGSVNYTYD